MNDLVAVRHMTLMKLNVLSIKKTAVVVVRSSTCGAPLRTTELTFPEHHLNEIMHTVTVGRNGLFAPLLSRLRFGGNSWRFVALRGDSRRIAAIRGDLLISDTTA